MFLKPNLHIVDRIIRILFGLFLIYIGFIDETMIKNDTVSYVVAGFGLVNVIVAFVRYCPLYNAIGLSTCKPKEDNNETPTA